MPSGPFNTTNLWYQQSHEESFAEALEIFFGTLDEYRLSSFQTSTLQSTETPLHADTLLRAFYKHAPSSRGRQGVVQNCLSEIYKYPEPVPPLPNASSDICTASLDLIVDHAKPIFHTLRNNEQTLEVVAERLFHFAEYLIACVFIPILSEVGHTPRVESNYETPKTRTPEHIGVKGRLRHFQRQLTAREGGRCAISRVPGLVFAARLFASGVIGRDEAGSAAKLDAVHIIPHGLGRVDPSGVLPAWKKYFWRLLYMFDPELGDLVNGDNIDQPHNGILLKADFHFRFGQLKLWFDATDVANTYKIGTAKDWPLSRDMQVTFTNNDTAIEHSLPHPRLLALHAALARILEASASEGYIGSIFREAEEVKCLAQDGSTPLSAVWIAKGLVGACA